MKRVLALCVMALLLLSVVVHADVIQGNPEMIRVVVETDKTDYEEGEPITITVSVKNDGAVDAKIEFPSSLQIDYEIDDGVFKYSDHVRFFAQMVSYMEIPAGEKVVHTFTHDSAQFTLKPGGHSVRASLVGLNIEGYTKFMVGTGPYPEPLPHGVYLIVDMSQRGYNYKEVVDFNVIAVNESDTDVTLDFPTTLQVDYVIDNAYRFSAVRLFPQVVTSVDIPRGSKFNWPVTITPEDYVMTPGTHEIRIELSGTEYYTYTKVYINDTIGPVPEGVKLSVTTDKTAYEMGDTIAFTMTAENTTGSDIAVLVDNTMPLKYMVERLYDDSSISAMEIFMVNNSLMDSRRPTLEDVVIPAGSSVSWDGRILEKRLLPTGRYTLSTGFRHYNDMATVVFTVNEGDLRASIVGTVNGFTDGRKDLAPLEGATVTVTGFVKDIKAFDNPTSDSWREFYTGQPVMTTTDAYGAFRFDDLSLFVNYSINIEKDGYLTYSSIIYTGSLETEIRPILQKYQEPTQDPLNFLEQTVSNCKITMGTGRYVFDTTDYFKGYFSIVNAGTEPVTFSFDNNTYVKWTLYNNRREAVWTKEGSWIDSTMFAYDLDAIDTWTLKSGEIREFYCIENIADMIPEIDGKREEGTYEFNVALMFTHSTDEMLTPDRVGGSVKIAIVPSNQAGVEIDSVSPEFVVNLRDSLMTVLDMKMTSSNNAGSINVSEVRENIYSSINNYRFIKMVIVDADREIRNNMKNALIRIYYDPADCEKPENLVIAHWKANLHTEKDQLNAEALDSWTMLDSRVDIENHYVEAETPDFSSFGLFENTAPIAVEEETPQVFSLAQNSPNPFNPTTTISFSLSSSGQVMLAIYNISGQEVARLVDGYLPAGAHNAQFNAGNLASGVYFYRIVSGGHTATRRMLLLK